MDNTQVWIVDFGSQYTQLITRRLREMHFSSEIFTIKKALKLFSEGKRPEALVFSGGPKSIKDDKNNYEIFFQDSKLPILGICYGMQLMSARDGGEVKSATQGEYGRSVVNRKSNQDLPFDQSTMWMSHGDSITKLPAHYDVLFESENGICAGIAHEKNPWWGLQFHPEVEHSERGEELLDHFLQKVAGLTTKWQPGSMHEECLNILPENPKAVLCAFSGGVDSLVAATLASEKYGDSLICFFVDHGLLRPQDLEHIQTLQNETKLHIEILDVKEQFFAKLKGVSEPEQKRKIIGNMFIEVFEEQIHLYEKSHGLKFDHLLQGTLYPDVIESTSPHEEDGASVTIKSHHNVGGLPERMKLKLVEPLRLLFKDEVRQMGTELGLKREWLYRHPFPGPGLGVRILGELTAPKIRRLQAADQVLFEEMKNFNVYDDIWQAACIYLPVQTVGVKGDGRAYEEVVAVRLVNSVDAMTATWSKVPYEFLDKVSSRITNEVDGITRVVYDITSKPPGTIEWE